VTNPVRRSHRRNLALIECVAENYIHASIDSGRTVSLLSAKKYTTQPAGELASHVTANRSPVPVGGLGGPRRAGGSHLPHCSRRLNGPRRSSASALQLQTTRGGRQGAALPSPCCSSPPAPSIAPGEPIRPAAGVATKSVENIQKPSWCIVNRTPCASRAAAHAWPSFSPNRRVFLNERHGGAFCRRKRRIYTRFKGSTPSLPIGRASPRSRKRAGARSKDGSHGHAAAASTRQPHLLDLTLVVMSHVRDDLEAGRTNHSTGPGGPEGYRSAGAGDG